jgi:3-methylcrotonyl-CoA carboxylase alpha subunit
MEMNTRLQVEHPVTEMILDLDLVELQLRIAAKEPLPFAQGDLAAKGHAVEARLYAENPATGFLPQSGTLHAFRTPDRERLRIDTGVRDGSEIMPYYDPMIAKLIAWGESRGNAIRTLHRALEETVVVGLATNLGFLSRILARHEFQQGGVTTDFIDAHIAELKGEALPQDLLGGAIAAWLDDADRAPAGMRGGWSLLGLPRKDFHAVIINGEPVAIEVSYEADGNKDVTAARSDGKFNRVTLERYAASFKDNKSGALFAAVGSEQAVIRAEDVLGRADAAGGGPAVVHAPMPGRIIAILVQEGEPVEPGQSLLILDAMKMEHTLKAGLNATVKRLPISIGNQVKEGDVLCVLEEATLSEGR